MNGYRLVDSGDGRRVEQVGPYRLVRQAVSAFWKPKLGREAWADPDAVHVRANTGGGHWEHRRPLPEQWPVEWGGQTMLVRPTPFGHLGLFPEHAAQWAWMADRVAGAGRPVRVLNLFAYTGGASVACARAGAEVVHVDAAKGIVDWARGNAEQNQVTTIRWVVEDAALFVAREKKRGRRYDAVLLDPPTFGRGARNELWKIEEHLRPLLEGLRGVVEPEPLFVLLSAHSPGFGGLTLANLLQEQWGVRPVEHGEMLVPADGGWPLPAGSFARF